MISSGLAAIPIHTFLDRRPAAVSPDNETEQIRFDAVLHGCVVYFGDQSAGPA